MALHTVLHMAKGLLLPLVLLTAWEWASRQGASAAYVVVSLSALFDTLLRLLANGELWLHLHTSLERTLAGLGIGATIGIAVGTLMAQSRVAERFIPLCSTPAKAYAMWRPDSVKWVTC